MCQDLQSEILKCLNANSGLEFDLDLLDESPTENTYFTLQKNQIQGSSFADNKSNIVKGPMGKSLLAESTGEYIAFASGAGVLSFLDLVAHIALTNLNILNPHENTEDCI